MINQAGKGGGCGGAFKGCQYAILGGQPFVEVDHFFIRDAECHPFALPQQAQNGAICEHAWHPDAAGLFLAGVILTLAAIQVGVRLAGLGLLGLAIWLLWFDLARRNLRHPIPLTRYIARCLYAGYFWLGLGGILSLWYGAVITGPAYDAVLHSIFIGFVISMIFGHAPIILPALLNRLLPYHPSFYLGLVLLHASLLLRIAGDLGGWDLLGQWGGLLNEISILLFLAILVITLRSQSRQTTRRGS